MATHSSVLAWRILGMGSHRVGYDGSDLAVAVAARENWIHFSEWRTTALDLIDLNIHRSITCDIGLRNMHISSLSYSYKFFHILIVGN